MKSGKIPSHVNDTANRGQNKLRKRICWANKPNMQSRELAVSSLFPTILDTFSDVVAFVLRETRYVTVAFRDLICFNLPLATDVRANVYMS